MMIELSASIGKALFSIGANHIKDTVEEISGEETDVSYFQTINFYIRIYSNISDGLVIEIARSNSDIKSAVEWRSLYSYTVPNFDFFSDEEIEEWLDKIPDDDDEYEEFVARHISIFKGKMYGPFDVA